MCVCACITLRGKTIETVYEFKYLRAIVEVQSEFKKDVQHRIAHASGDFGALCIYFPRSLFIPDHKKDGVPFCGAQSTSLWGRDVG